MATTNNTILLTEPDIVHTLESLSKLVRIQASDYLSSHPYNLEHNPWLQTHLQRLIEAPISNKQKGGTPQRSFPDIMHEDLLLDLSRNLTYRTDIIKHATRYKNLLKLDFRDCKDCDVELCLEEYLALAPLPSSSSLKERQKRLAMRQQRLGAFQRVLNLVVDADLFVASPNKHYSHIEAKGTMYLTFVILANEGMKAEHQIARLKAARKDVCRGNVYQPEYIIGCPGPKMEALQSNGAGKHLTNGCGVSQPKCGGPPVRTTPEIIIRGFVVPPAGTASAWGG